MSTVVIAGAGGLGRELHDWICSSPRWRQALNVTEIAFVADGVPQAPIQKPLRTSVHDYLPQPSDWVIVAIGDPQGRARVADALSSVGARYATFIHDSAIVTRRVEQSDGALICPNVVVGDGTSFGRHVLVNVNSYVGHDSDLGDFVTLSPGCSLGGGVRIGEAAFLGIGATALPGVAIGAGSIIGAGATVVEEVEPRTVAVGTPARAMRPVTRRDGGVQP